MPESKAWSEKCPFSDVTNHGKSLEERCRKVRLGVEERCLPESGRLQHVHGALTPLPLLTRSDSLLLDATGVTMLRSMSRDPPQRHGAAGPRHQGQRPARRRRRRRRQRLLPLPGSLQRPARALGHGAVGALAGLVFQSLVRGLPRSAGRGVAFLLSSSSSSSGLAVLGPGPGRAGHAGKRGSGRLLQPHLDDVVHGHAAEALLLLRRVVVEGDGPDLAAAAVGEAVAAVDPGVAAAAVAQGPLLDAVAVGGLGGGGQLGPRLAVPHYAGCTARGGSRTGSARTDGKTVG